MSSSFFGFNIGVRALTASQKALEVISHNIANINTDGYKKQDVVLKTTQPEGIPQINRSISAGQLGSGVFVSEIKRMYDQYIERELNNELQNNGKWEAGIKSFEQIETILDETSDNGLRKMMDDYWNSLEDLGASPENYSVRKSLVENTKSLCSLFRSKYEKLQKLRQDINTEIELKIKDINNLASQIKDLNKLIKEISISQDNPNDLMDQRDSLINQLNKIINIDVKETSFNQVDIFIGGTAIVRENNNFMVDASLNAETGFYDIKWSDTNRPVEVKNGELYSLLNFRDVYIPDIMNKLDNLANFFIIQTNNIHKAGFGLDGTSTGYDYFVGSSAADININPDIDSDITLIAASKNPNQPGDNSNIIDILNLRNQKILDSNTTKPDDYYNNMIVKIGVEAQQCERERQNSQLLLDKINERKESVSGVSLDEELVNMVKYQHAYNAAAKIINVMDSLFETIIKDLS